MVDLEDSEEVAVKFLERGNKVGPSPECPPVL